MTDFEKVFPTVKIVVDEHNVSADGIMENLVSLAAEAHDIFGDDCLESELDKRYTIVDSEFRNILLGNAVFGWGKPIPGFPWATELQAGEYTRYNFTISGVTRQYEVRRNS